MEQRIINSGKMAISDLVQLAQYGDDKLFIDYDKEADVLYVSFGKPQKAETDLLFILMGSAFLSTRPNYLIPGFA